MLLLTDVRRRNQRWPFLGHVALRHQRRHVTPQLPTFSRMKFMYGNIRVSITHVEYHDHQLEALPRRHFVGKCILALTTEAARWKYALERPFPFLAPFVFSKSPPPANLSPNLNLWSLHRQPYSYRRCERLYTYIRTPPFIFSRVDLRRDAASLRVRPFAHVLCTHDDNFTRWEQIVRRNCR